MGNAGYVVAGYGVTALAVGAYVATLFARARRARRMVEAVAEQPASGDPV